MKVWPILQIGDPRLRQSTLALTPTELASPQTQTFIDELIATMRDANGAGLAASQVGVLRRICVLEIGDNPRYPYKPKVPLTILVNPELTPVSSETFSNYEGCLSVPNLRGRVDRWSEIRVKALDREGKAIDEVWRGISAGTVQHECDHLDGKLFIDRVADPGSFSTWDNFRAYHEERFRDEVEAVVSRFGS